MDLNGWDASHTIPHGSYMGRREFLNKYQVSIPRMPLEKKKQYCEEGE